MKPYILFIYFLVTITPAFSQNYVDILKVNVSTTPNNNFDSTAAQTKISQYDADLTVPIKINEHSAFITGLIYENIETKLFVDGNVKSFGSTTLKLGFNKQFNEKWSGTFVALPKIASDYKSIDSKDYQIGGIGLLKYKKRDNLFYKVGLYYNSELFGPFFVPMFGMYYLSPNKKFEANVMLPLQADINYKVIPFINIGCNFNGQVRSYHLSDVTPSNHSTYVARATNELYAYLKFNLTKNLSLQTKVGQSVARRYRVYDENDKVYYGAPLIFVGGHREQLNTDFSDGMIYQVSLLFKVSTEKSK